LPQPPRRLRPGARFLLGEGLFWFLLPAIFLANYIFAWHRPAAAAASHLLFIALLGGAALLVRILVQRRSASRWSLAAVAALYGLLLFALIAYYSLVQVVLGVWGRVITVELIRTYGAQAEGLCEAVGIALPAALALLAAGFALCWAFAYAYLSRAAWRPVLHARPRWLSDLLLLSALLLAGYHLLDFVQTSTRHAEPVSLTMWSGKPGHSARSYSQGLPVPRQLSERETAVAQAYAPAPLASTPNLVLIVVDALRYDHMGVYGYARPTTPYLQALAARGVLGIAAQTRASCGETTCGLASLASSRYSHDMPDQPFTLAKVVQRHGYRLQMIMGDAHGDREVLYGRIDDYFDGSMATGTYLDDDSFILKKSAAMAHWDGRPLMLQYHLMAAHTLGKRHKQYLQFQPAERYAGKTAGEPDPRHTNYYDGGVLQADDEIGQLLGGLEAKGYLRDALVVITADHGEALGEHGKFSHAGSVYEQLLRVPLLTLRYVDGRAQPGRNYPQWSSQVDIAPTILHELGMPIPSSWSGRALQAGATPGFTFYQMVPYLGLYDHRDPGHLWKFFYNASTQEEYAFDLKADPQEQRNLALTAPAALRAQWRARLREIDRSTGEQAAPTSSRP
jgi:glucan phosphoethanolaminetransferase (alkaline phosphatase superfamily)